MVGTGDGGQGVGCGGARGWGWMEAALECNVPLEIVGEMHGVLKADLETDFEAWLRLCQSWRSGLRLRLGSLLRWTRL